MLNRPLSFRSGVATRYEKSHTPFHSAISARPRQGLLGTHQARSDPDSPLPRDFLASNSIASDFINLRFHQQGGFEPSLTRDVSGQLMHPTLSKTSTRAPRDYRLTQGLSMRPSASRRWPRFGRWAPGTGPTLVTPESTLLGVRPLTPVSLADLPDGEAGSIFQPMSLRLSSRERRWFPQHRTPSASKGAFLGPFGLTRCCHLAHPLDAFSPLAAVFSGLIALG